MRIGLIGIVWLVLAAVASAQTVLVIDQAGTYILQDGKLIGPVAVIRPGDSPVPPQPPGPNPPPTPGLSERATAIKTAAMAATADSDRAGTVANLVEAHQQLQPLIGDKINGYEQVAWTAKLLWNKAEGSNSQAWAPTRKIVFDELAKLAQEGADDVAYAAYFGEIVAGLTASVPEGMRQEAGGEFLKWLLMFIKEILPILLQIFGGI